MFVFSDRRCQTKSTDALEDFSHVLVDCKSQSSVRGIIIDVDWMQNAVLQWPVTHPTPRKASRMKGDHKPKPKSRSPNTVALPLPWETLKTPVNVYCSFSYSIHLFCNTDCINVVNSHRQWFIYINNIIIILNAPNVMLKAIIADF